MALAVSMSPKMVIKTYSRVAEPASLSCKNFISISLYISFKNRLNYIFFQALIERHLNQIVQANLEYSKIARIDLLQKFCQEKTDGST